MPGLRLAADAHVLVIPDVRLPLRWQAESGVPASMVGGGATIEPDRTGQATSYIYHRLAATQYLYALWQGSPPGRAPSQSQIRRDLAYSAACGHRHRHQPELTAGPLPDR